MVLKSESEVGENDYVFDCSWLKSESGTGNEYRPKCGDALRLGSKSRIAIPIRG